MLPQVKFLDLRHCARPGDAEVQAELAEAARRPLPPSRPVLMRTTVAHLAEGLHVIVFTCGFRGRWACRLGAGAAVRGWVRVRMHRRSQWMVWAAVC